MLIVSTFRWEDVAHVGFINADRESDLFQFIKCPFPSYRTDMDVAPAGHVFLGLKDFRHGFPEGFDMFLPILVRFHFW